MLIENNICISIVRDNAPIPPYDTATPVVSANSRSSNVIIYIYIYILSGRYTNLLSEDLRFVSKRELLL